MPKDCPRKKRKGRGRGRDIRKEMSSNGETENAAQDAAVYEGEGETAVPSKESSTFAVHETRSTNQVPDNDMVNASTAEIEVPENRTQDTRTVENHESSCSDGTDGRKELNSSEETVNAAQDAAVYDGEGEASVPLRESSIFAVHEIRKSISQVPDKNSKDASIAEIRVPENKAVKKRVSCVCSGDGDGMKIMSSTGGNADDKDSVHLADLIRNVVDSEACLPVSRAYEFSSESAKFQSAFAPCSSESMSSRTKSSESGRDKLEDRHATKSVTNLRGV